MTQLINDTKLTGNEPLGGDPLMISDCDLSAMFGGRKKNWAPQWRHRLQDPVIRWRVLVARHEGPSHRCHAWLAQDHAGSS